MSAGFGTCRHCGEPAGSYGERTCGGCAVLLAGIDTVLEPAPPTTAEIRALLRQEAREREHIWLAHQASLVRRARRQRDLLVMPR